MATISDVAKRAGVSPVTVSRVINNAGNVSAATQERVRQAIQELGYVPSGVARSLRSRQTLTLGLILPDITNSFWTTVARGVEDAAQSRGYSILLCNTDENPVKQRRYLEVVASQRVDGVIIAPYDSNADNLSLLRTRQIPTVVVDRHLEGWDVDTVHGDSVSGARALVQHLIDLGRRRIAIITGPVNTSTARDRVTGYHLALAAAGIPDDPQLVKFGEFRLASGERLTNKLLDLDDRPVAIFAGNNAIAVGAIEAILKRGLRIPQDIALVTFDDLANASRLFPFLTVAVQPVYEIGANAAQLLLSRLDAETYLQPRHVVLPARLIVRHSCGSKLADPAGRSLSLPLDADLNEQTSLVQRVSSQEMAQNSERLLQAGVSLERHISGPTSYDLPDIKRLLKALRHEEADRVPHLDFWITSQDIYEYVLERRLDYAITAKTFGEQSVAPEDHVEFARRLGMDAVVCNFTWRPNNIFSQSLDGAARYVDGGIKSWSDLENLEPPPSLANQLNYLERYLRVSQGTGVGVVAHFTSFFDSAMLAIGFSDAFYLFYDNRPFLERLMDILLAHQQRVMQAVCDRFADELAFVLISDDIAHNAGLLIRPDMFEEIFPHRMKRLIAPAKERSKLVGMHSNGKLDQVIPLLHQIGFDILHPVEPEANDIFALKRQWAGKIALIGNIPSLLLAYGAKERIEEQVKEYCARLAPGGGYVLGASKSIVDGIPPENYLAMVQAVHKYGRYGA